MGIEASQVRRDGLSEHGYLTFRTCLRIIYRISGDNFTSRSTLMAVKFRHGVESNQLRACQSRSFTERAVMYTLRMSGNSRTKPLNVDMAVS